MTTRGSNRIPEMIRGIQLSLRNAEQERRIPHLLSAFDRFRTELEVQLRENHQALKRLHRPLC
jgi:hypothetical protein